MTRRLLLHETEHFFPVVSCRRLRYQADGFDLDLSYVTPKMIVAATPASAMPDTLFRDHTSELTEFFRRRHKVCVPVPVPVRVYTRACVRGRYCVTTRACVCARERV